MCSLCWQPYSAWSMLQEDGITELPPIFETWEAKNLSWNLPCGLIETKTVSFKPRGWCKLMISYSRAVTQHSGSKSLTKSTNCMNEQHGRHACTRNAAHESRKTTTNTPRSTFTEYVKSHSSTCHDMDVEREKLSQLRALIGQLLWWTYAMCATIVGVFATVDGTITGTHGGHDFEVVNIGFLKRLCGPTRHSKSPLITHRGHQHRCKMDNLTNWNVTKKTAGLHRKRRAVAMSRISCHLSLLKRLARSSGATETQRTADGDDDAVCIRSCLSEVLFGPIDLQNRHTEARHCPAALVDCRGVYNALARSSSFSLAWRTRNLAWKRLLSNRLLFNVARWYANVTAQM